MMSSPIIVVQDSNFGHVSTTNDILNQLELLQYCPTLKGIELDQFMNMTNEQDFKQFGIKKTDCRKLSLAAQSIKSSFDEDDEDDDDDSVSVDNKRRTSFQSLLQRFRSSDDTQSISTTWPNSKRRISLPIKDTTLPAYETTLRRHSFSDVEELPGYTCTVQKMGKATAKIEFLEPNKKPTRRPWKEVYIELQGTMIRLYEQRQPRHSYYNNLYHDATEKYYLNMKISLANARVEIPLDYTKRPNVFRLVVENGPQILFQVQTCAAVLLWIEKISSGINIAGNMDHMPKFPPSLFLFENSTNMDYDVLVHEEYQRNLLNHDDSLI